MSVDLARDQAPALEHQLIRTNTPTPGCVTAALVIKAALL